MNLISNQEMMHARQ